MNLVAKINSTVVSPLLDGSRVLLRRPVSSAQIVLDDPDGSLSVSELQSVEIRINNELTRTEQLDHADWTKSGVTISADATTEPLYSVTSADKIVEDSGTSEHRVEQSITLAADGESVVFSAYVKAAERTDCQLRITQKDGSTQLTATVDLSLGTVVASGGAGAAGGSLPGAFLPGAGLPGAGASGGGSATASITDVGGGWYRVALFGSVGTGVSNPVGAVLVGNGSGFSYAGDGSSGIYCWGLQWQSSQITLVSYTPVVIDAQMFDGFVIAIDTQPSGIGDARTLSAQCVDWNWRLDHPPAAITKSYIDSSDQDIIIDAVTEAGLNSDITATTSTVAEIVASATVAFDGATLRDVIDEMIRISGGVAWMEGKTLTYATEAGVTASAWNVNTESPSAPSSYDVQELRVNSRHDDPLNSVLVVGPPLSTGGRASASASDSTSIAAIGTWHRKIEVPTVFVDSYAQTVADQLVTAGKDPRLAASFRYFDDSGELPLKANQKISITSSRFGLSAQSFVTREVRISQLVGGVSRFDVTVGDFQPSVTDILRRLETSSKTSSLSATRLRGLDFVRTNSEYAITAASVANLEDMAEFSIRVTFSVDSTPTAAMGIVAKYDAAANTGWNLAINPGSGSVTLTRTKTSVNYAASFNITPTAGQVYTLVLRSKAGTLAEFWLDGVKQTSGGGVGSGSTHSDVGDAVEIGTYDGGNYIDGFISSLVIWDMLLPETTAATAHSASLSGLPFSGNAQLILPLDEFDDGSTATGSNTLLDRSGNGYHATPTNTPTGASVIILS